MHIPARVLTLMLVGLATCTVIIAAGCASSRRAADEEDKSDEVDVAYGTQERKSITGAVSTVDVDAAMKSTPRELSDMLRGRVAGVHVEEGPGGIRVVIRGGNSFRGNTQPLYVIDGVPIIPSPDGTVPINPHDVASISVLKDASATTLYGSRGANGVILIKTKRAFEY